MLVFHADVNVSRMSQEIFQFNGEQDYEQSAKTDNYQYPQQPGMTINKNRLTQLAPYVTLKLTQANTSLSPLNWI